MEVVTLPKRVVAGSRSIDTWPYIIFVTQSGNIFSNLPEGMNTHIFSVLAVTEKI